MRAEDALGILVNTDQHFEFVAKLAEAAAADGRPVRIHLRGAGVRMLHENAMGPLSQISRVSICADSLRRHCREAAIQVPPSVDVVAPDQLAAILKSCRRQVVF